MSLLVAEPDLPLDRTTFRDHVERALAAISPCVCASQGSVFGPPKDGCIDVKQPTTTCRPRCWNIAGCNLVRALIEAESRVTIEPCRMDRYWIPTLTVYWKATKTRPPYRKKGYSYARDARGRYVHNPHARFAHELTHIFLYLQQRNAYESMEWTEQELSAAQGENQVRVELGAPMRVRYYRRDVEPLWTNIIPVTEEDLVGLSKNNGVWWKPAITLQPDQRGEWDERYRRMGPSIAGRPRDAARRVVEGLTDGLSRITGSTGRNPRDLQGMHAAVALSLEKRLSRAQWKEVRRAAQACRAWCVSEQVNLEGPYSVTFVGAAKQETILLSNTVLEATDAGWRAGEPASRREYRRCHRLTVSGGQRAKELVSFLESLDIPTADGSPQVGPSSVQILTISAGGRLKQTHLQGYAYPLLNARYHGPTDSEDRKCWEAIVEVHKHWERLIQAAKQKGIAHPLYR